MSCLEHCSRLCPFSSVGGDRIPPRLLCRDWLEQSLRPARVERARRVRPLSVMLPSQESATDGRQEELRKTEVRQVRGQARRERDAPTQEGNAEERPQREDREEPQAGDRHRTVRSAREGRQGAAQALELPEVELEAVFIAQEVDEKAQSLTRTS